MASMVRSSLCSVGDEHRHAVLTAHLIIHAADNTHGLRLTLSQQAEGSADGGHHQRSRLGRYSFKNAFLLFLDVWGLGNRGMFRTLRDLILRPGYMAYDYLKGMMMAYFPPFKLFFLLIALSLLVESGFNVRRVNRLEESMELYDKMEMENTTIMNRFSRC